MIQRPIICRRFIGRGDELAYLHERRREAGASHGGLVLVAGEAGVGKSRLVTEFASSLAKSRYRVAQSACLEFAQRPYGPILSLLARLDPAAARIVPAASKHEQFESIAEAFVRVAARTAVVAVVEDLHWADVATIELLTFLGSRLPAMRMLVVGSLRPEEMHVESSSSVPLAKLARTTNAARIELGPLTADEQTAFIDEALQEIALPAETRRAVARASEGNPFFLEELLKSAVERSRRGGARSAALPDTVQATLLERIRPLGEDERRVVEQAAVIGRHFDVGVLADTLERDVSSLLPALRRARDLQLIEERDAETFRFRHALTREAIYGSFLGAEVREMHRRIALVCEHAPDGRRSIESLAYHWWAAGDRERGARYGEQAGDAAAALHAHDDAIAFYERAAEAVAGDDARARLHEKVADRRVALAQYAEALAAYQDAADRYRAADETDAEARCRVRASLQTYTLGRPEPTRELHEMLRRIPARALLPRARLHVGIAWMAASFYETTAASEHLDAVRPQALRAALDVAVRYHNVRAWVAMLLGDAERFRAEHDAWLDAARAFGGLGLLAGAHYNGAYCYALFGLHEDARRHGDAALAIAERERSPHLAGSALGMIAFAAVLRGDLSAARDCVTRMLALRSDNQVMHAHATAWGTFAASHLGDEALLERLFARPQGDAAPDFAEMAGAGLAAVLVRRGRAGEARALLHAGLGTGERRRGDVLTMLAVARYGEEADIPRAREVLRSAADTPHEIVERHALALFDAVVAHRFGHHGDARARAADAAPGFRRLRFPLLEAQALELAGDVAAAVAVYEACGAAHDVRRLTRGAAANGGPAMRSANGAASTASLSPREREIALLVAEGLPNLEIAHRLAISQKTVEKHLGSAFQKLGFSSRAQLAAHVGRDSPHAAAPSGRAR